jgi:polysaccharide export outer membrane protein
MRMKAVWLYSLILVLCWGFLSLAEAQEYVLEPGDVLTVSFWQQPDLNTQARIDAEGKIDLPLAGRIVAAGLTIPQLSSKIVERISIYNKNVTQATVVIVEYGSRKVFITGAVATPGKYHFERIPNIWEAILEAGGPLPTAQLDNVRLVRGGTESGQIIEVDLTAAFERGDMRGLPEVKPGDNIYIPGGAQAGAGGVGGVVPGAGTSGTLFSRKKSVYVFGQVAVPGVYQIEKDMDVLQAIIQAGGPAYPNRTAGGGGPTLVPDMENVKIISHGPEAPVVYSVNLEKYTHTAAPLPLILRPGDTVYVPGKEAFRSFFLNTTATEVIKASAAVITSYILLRWLFGNTGQNTP